MYTCSTVSHRPGHACLILLISWEHKLDRKHSLVLRDAIAECGCFSTLTAE